MSCPHAWPERRATVIGLAALALTTRGAYWWSTRAEPLRSDASTYHELATNLAGGRGFSHTFPQLALHPTAFRPPLYPFLLSLVYRVPGTGAGVGRGCAVLVGVSVPLVCLWVVSRHAGPVAGTVAAVAVAVHPALVANDTTTLTEGPSLVLILLLVDRVLGRHWAAAGLLAGALALTRPSAQPLVVLVAGWLLWRVGWRAALGAMAVATLVMAPWIVRNEVVVGTSGLVTSNGFTLAAMYSSSARQRGTFVDPVIAPEFDDLRLVQFDEAEWDRQLRQRALDHVRMHPEQVLDVAARNAVAFLELRPSFNENAEVLDGRNMAVRSATLPLFYAITAAGIIGLVRARRLASSLLLLLLLAITAVFTLGSLLLVAPPRLRAPFDLAMCVGVGLLASERWRRSSRLAPSADAAAGIGAADRHSLP